MRSCEKKPFAHLGDSLAESFIPDQTVGRTHSPREISSRVMPALAGAWSSLLLKSQSHRSEMVVLRDTTTKTKVDAEGGICPMRIDALGNEKSDPTVQRQCSLSLTSRRVPFPVRWSRTGW